MFENIVLLNSVLMEFLILFFLIVIVYFLNKLEICFWGSWIQLFIIYLVMVGFIGINKIVVIDVICNVILDVESVNGICDLQFRVN